MARFVLSQIRHLLSIQKKYHRLNDRLLKKCQSQVSEHFLGVALIWSGEGGTPFHNISLIRSPYIDQSLSSPQ